MASLVGQLIKNIYKGLIKTVDNDVLTATPKNITDGYGNASALNIGTTSIVISGSLTVTGSIIGNITSASFASTASYAMNGGGGGGSTFPFSGSAVITGSLSNGLGNITSGFYSHVEGENTTAIGYASHAEGNVNTAIGNYSHAEGQSTTSIGNWSHAEGLNTKAIGYYSHAEGVNNTANGSYSHAEGNSTTAIGLGSHAEGNFATSIGTYSHAEGYYTIANGYASHAEGLYTIASSSWNGSTGITQHAEGRYNIPDTTSLLIVGNGTTAVSRSNAFSITTFNSYATASAILAQVSESCNFTNDTAASTGGIPLGGLYHTAGTIKIRLV